MSSVPARLLQRLDALGEALSRRGDAIALIGLGSVGADLHRLDDYSDLDFFVVVEDDAKPRYLDSIGWLEEAAPVAYSFENTADGRKVLFDDGLYAEYAVFTLGELRTASFTAGRIAWQRDDAPAGLEHPARPAAQPATTAEFQANEALTNLYVGLLRDARGEKLSASRLIQTHAVDRVIALQGLLRPETAQQDPFAPERGVEGRFGADLPLAQMVPGYNRNRDAARSILEWLEARVALDETLAAAIRALCG
jgi:hypothetical protein